MEVPAAPLGLVWALPFAGMLLSIAVLPPWLPNLWHKVMVWVALFWATALLLPQALLLGPHIASAGLVQAAMVEYLPLISLLLALYVAGGGMLIEGGPFGTPTGNTLLLATGVGLAAVLGTTGAAMVLIRPLLRANAQRRRQAHLVIFFILLVANAGGAILPLGPPLYIGFLHGVAFTWPLRALAGPLIVSVLPLLGVFWCVDRWLGHAEPAATAPCEAPGKLRIEGAANLLLVAVLVAIVLIQGSWHPGTISILGQPIALTRIAGTLGCLLVALISLAITPAARHAANEFRWEPMQEVAVLFAGLFATIGPVLAMLREGANGPLAHLLAITTTAAGAPRPFVYFWLTGLMSGFLDNAPTYLMFFQQAGGDAAALTSRLASTLVAISSGAVLFGGLSYVGNAPNMMLRSIAVHHDVRMPGFFAYVGIAAILLLPGLLAISLIFL